MNSLAVAPVAGRQSPRVGLVPDSVASTGREAVELAAMAGLILDPWQEHVLTVALGERPDGRWSAFEVGVCVARQNGKGSILEARELAGLFLLDEERLIIHSAHQFDTSLEAFRRLLALVENCDDLRKRVKKVSRSHGEEGIELLDGSRVRFRTRTKGGGRGFTGDCLILDEAMILPEQMHGALLPTLSARPNPQVWYAGSAVDQDIHEHGRVFARVRERALAGEDAGLAYFEWGLDYPSPDVVPAGVAADPEAWAVANPGLGIRIGGEHVGFERASMDPRTFAVERLGVGDWPAGDGSAMVIDPEAWNALIDPQSRIDGGVCFAFDVTPDRAYASIAAAGARPDGLAHLEIVEHRRGTGWLVERLAGLAAAHPTLGVVCDGAGPAGSLVTDLEAHGVQVSTVSAGEHAQACGRLFDGVMQASFRHLGTPELTSAVRGAAKRQLGDAWAWSRKNSGVDISPLVAGTLALWGSADGMFIGGFSWD
jgi:hypothetical protein